MARVLRCSTVLKGRGSIDKRPLAWQCSAPCASAARDFWRLLVARHPQGERVPLRLCARANCTRQSRRSSCLRPSRSACGSSGSVAGRISRGSSARPSSSSTTRRVTSMTRCWAGSLLIKVEITYLKSVFICVSVEAYVFRVYTRGALIEVQRTYYIIEFILHSVGPLALVPQLLKFSISI